MERSPRLKLAVGWLLVTQVGLGLVLLFVLGLSAEEKFWGVATAALITWVLYGVWNHRRWAKYPLIVLLLLSFLIAAFDTPDISDPVAIASFVLALLWAAADGVAYLELKKATGIDPPII